MNSFFKELSSLSLSDSFWNLTKQRLKNVTGGENRFLAMGSGDFFYLPRHFFPETLPVLQLLGKHQIFLEIGVISALRPVSNDFQIVNGDAHDCGNGKIRGRPIEQAYSTEFEIFHPFKMGHLPSYMIYKHQNSTEIASNCVFCNLVDISYQLSG